LEDRIDLTHAVERLPPRQKLAVDCFYFVGLSVAETAAVMGCSEGTVKSTLSDARTRLRQALGGEKR
jgi:RNA polymerase sigma-70 factor (ECF subfamily)